MQYVKSKKWCEGKKIYGNEMEEHEVIIQADTFLSLKNCLDMPKQNLHQKISRLIIECTNLTYFPDIPQMIYQ